jgi:bleomycin hydrolase
MIRRTLMSSILGFAFLLPVIAQPLDNAIRKEIENQAKPVSINEFVAVPHLSPINQDTTSVCWSFATTSFIESEMMRLGLDTVRLAVMFPVYNIFLEKAKRFIATRGASRFAAGDLYFGVWETVRKYGVVPQSVYRGSTCSWETRNHDSLYAQLENLMRKIKEDKAWDEEEALSKVRQILDQHLGTPPASFEYKGKKYTPRTFADEVVRLPWDRYVKITSFLYAPFHSRAEMRVPDNWMHDSTFFNVPLDAWYRGIKEALGKGYTLAIDADISEPSYRLGLGAVIVPACDLPVNALTQESREFRFSNGSTEDDHLLHIVGFKSVEDKDWFLIKDSWRTAWKSSHPGYVFFDESYMKLKVLSYLVHEDAVRGSLKSH